ncbi:hypothetical protein [Edaphobacter dinghuensis]|uniref:Uncharacterized protein n=1 Tax=Edaphobacter dinghuensis TaxID=1560005 RepID=A0A917M474_9BACT|nr:hypothetical protein [Edaphobacter dinghuensis]GGG76255.1 hypothetical protein GCM10011585_18960 [Edaphobacter dinghuensis]
MAFFEPFIVWFSFAVDIFSYGYIFEPILPGAIRTDGFGVISNPPSTVDWDSRSRANLGSIDYVNGAETDA